jgi:hypothetical protein
MFYEGMQLVFFDFETTGINARGEPKDDKPIQLGMILTNDKLIIQKSYQTYIKWDWMDYYDVWSGDYINAYKIHGIPLHYLKYEGRSPSEIISDISFFLPSQNNSQYKPTLVSDNAYFDTLMMHKLFNVSNDDFYDYFHYTTWDINMLYTSLGIKKASEHTHDALSDAANMYHRTLRALEKINYFN